jgi:CBS domain-containing protein
MTTTYTQHTHAKSLDSVRVAEAMHHGLITCQPNTTLHTIARLIAGHRIHAVVVAPGEESDGWSLLSDLDLAAAVADGSFDRVKVGQIASTPNVFVRPDETIARAAQLMRDYDTHHLVVLARGGNHPIGMISTLDVADVVAELPRPSSKT